MSNQSNQNLNDIQQKAANLLYGGNEDAFRTNHIKEKAITDALSNYIIEKNELLTNNSQTTIVDKIYKEDSSEAPYKIVNKSTGIFPFFFGTAGNDKLTNKTLRDETFNQSLITFLSKEVLKGTETPQESTHSDSQEHDWGKLETQAYLKLFALLNPNAFVPFYKDEWVDYALKATGGEKKSSKIENNKTIAAFMQNNGICYREMLEVANTYCDKNPFSKIDKNKQLVYTGAPGTGKTYGIRSFVLSRCKDPKDALINYNVLIKGEEAISITFKQYEFIQFHASYDYSDFIEGLRPIDSNRFVRVDGIFMEFCRHVAEYIKYQKDKEMQFYFIIDEINRADIGKVMGELMFGLEEGYRGKTFKTQYANLPTHYYDERKKKWLRYKRSRDDESSSDEIGRMDVFEDGFFVPENIHIIGSMNDIDRSVETFDFALRRRFQWIPILVPSGKTDLKNRLFTLLHGRIIDYIYSKALTGEEHIDAKKLIDSFDDLEKNHLSPLAEAINDLNLEISERKGKSLNLSPDYHIGLAYFKDYDFNKTGYEARNIIWNEKILPILKEYVRGRDFERTNSFILNCTLQFRVGYPSYNDSLNTLEKYKDEIKNNNSNIGEKPEQIRLENIAKNIEYYNHAVFDEIKITNKSDYFVEETFIWETINDYSEDSNNKTSFWEYVKNRIKENSETMPEGVKTDKLYKNFKDTNEDFNANKRSQKVNPLANTVPDIKL